ncbi:MAG: hypothetical protein R6U61_03560 [Thermoplasmata archaeon]
MKIKYLLDPFISVVILLFLLGGVVVISSVYSGNVVRSGTVPLSSQEGQVARPYKEIIVFLDEGDVIWVEYSPDPVRCTISLNESHVLEEGERYQVQEDGFHTIRFEYAGEVRLRYEVHKEGYDQGEDLIYFSAIPLSLGIILLIYWYKIVDKSEMSDDEFVGTGEALKWRGPMGYGKEEGVDREPGHRYLAVPISCSIASLFTFLSWTDIRSVFLIIGESSLTFCCGWVILPAIVGYISGFLVSPSQGVSAPEGIGGLVGGLLATALVAPAHVMVVTAGSNPLIIGVYSLLCYGYITGAITYSIVH